MQLFTQLHRNGNRYTFTLNDNLRRIFPEDFWYEYSELSEELPDWVAQIPLLANVAPAIWLTGERVSISSCEMQFWDALKNLKEVFKRLYPEACWDGEIVCENIFVATGPSNAKNKVAMLFSGGLDSVTTLIRHHKEQPLLLCVNGADVALNDTDRWLALHNNTQAVAEQFNTKACFVTSNFRTFLNRNHLRECVKTFSDKDWWMGFQHGWGLCGFLVPLLWNSQGAVGYIASSDHIEDQSRIGSRPDIDECMKWNDGRIVHDGTQYRRHNKVQYLCEQQKLGLSIPAVKVCLRSFAAGENCCMCEKCARTIATFLTVGHSQPELFGFQEYKKMGKDWLPIFLRNLEKGRFRLDSDWDLIQRDIKPIDWYQSAGLKDYQLDFIKWLSTANLDALREAREAKLSSKRHTPVWLKELGRNIRFPKPLFLRVLWNRFKDRNL